MCAAGPEYRSKETERWRDRQRDGEVGDPQEVLGWNGPTVIPLLALLSSGQEGGHVASALNRTLAAIAYYSNVRPGTWDREVKRRARPELEALLRDIGDADEADRLLGKNLFDRAMELWTQLRKLVKIGSQRYPTTRVYRACVAFPVYVLTFVCIRSLVRAASPIFEVDAAWMTVLESNHLLCSLPRFRLFHENTRSPYSSVFSTPYVFVYSADAAQRPCCKLNSMKQRLACRWLDKKKPACNNKWRNCKRNYISCSCNGSPSRCLRSCWWVLTS